MGEGEAHHVCSFVNECKMLPTLFGKTDGQNYGGTVVGSNGAKIPRENNSETGVPRLSGIKRFSINKGSRIRSFPIALTAEINHFKTVKLKYDVLFTDAHVHLILCCSPITVVVGGYFLLSLANHS